MSEITETRKESFERKNKQRKEKNMNKQEQRKENILLHGLKLQRIFPESRKFGPAELCKKLHRIEVKESRLNELMCSVEGIMDINSPEFDKHEAATLKRLDNILGYKEVGVPVFINRDPRGYALKIESEFTMGHGLDIPKDWGGYGLLCPEF